MGQEGGEGSLAKAQIGFQDAIKRAMAKLEGNGRSKGEAVQVLLDRISSAKATPEDSKVENVMKTRNVSREDAVRAVVVFEELQRLRKCGMDTLAAVEEITRRMVSLSPSEPEDMEANASSANVSSVSNKGKKRSRNTNENPLVLATSSSSSDSTQTSIMKYELRRRNLHEESPISQMVKRLKKIPVSHDVEKTDKTILASTQQQPLLNTGVQIQQQQVPILSATQLEKTGIVQQPNPLPNSAVGSSRSKRKNPSTNTCASDGSSTRESKRTRRKK